MKSLIEYINEGLHGADNNDKLVNAVVRGLKTNSVPLENVTYSWAEISDKDGEFGDALVIAYNSEEYDAIQCMAILRTDYTGGKKDADYIYKFETNNRNKLQKGKTLQTEVEKYFIEEQMRDEYELGRFAAECAVSKDNIQITATETKANISFTKQFMPIVPFAK